MVNGSSFSVKVANYNTVTTKLLLLAAPQVLLLLNVNQLLPLLLTIACTFLP